MVTWYYCVRCFYWRPVKIMWHNLSFWNHLEYFKMTGRIFHTPFLIFETWNGAKDQGSLMASPVPVDGQVRVFKPSGLIDRPSDCLSVRNIPLSVSMEIRFCYILFSYQVLISI